jgi:hypothetical protein
LRSLRLIGAVSNTESLPIHKEHKCQ